MDGIIITKASGSFGCMEQNLFNITKLYSSFLSFLFKNNCYCTKQIELWNVEFLTVTIACDYCTKFQVSTFTILVR